MVQRALRAWPQAQRTSEEQYVYLDSVALNLHSFYSGVERLFELIARHVDGVLPAGETWHHDLLQQMAQEVADARPSVIDQGSALTLDEFRKFRHLVRNIYTANLVPDKMARLILALPGLWSQLHAELLAFAQFLEELSAEEDASDSEKGD